MGGGREPTKRPVSPSTGARSFSFAHAETVSRQTSAVLFSSVPSLDSSFDSSFAGASASPAPSWPGSTSSVVAASFSRLRNFARASLARSSALFVR